MLEEDIKKMIEELEEEELTEELDREHHVYRREQENLRPEDEVIIDPRERLRRVEVGYDGIIWENDDKDELSEREVRRIGRGLEHDGIDALAWYRSYHWYPSSLWGIYITNYGVRHLRTKYGFPKGSLASAEQLLFLHEFYHFLVDIAATALELGGGSGRPLYVNYIRRVYLQPQENYHPIEEALANAFAYKRMIRRGTGPQTRDFMVSQPQGYSSFLEYFSGAKCRIGERELGASIAGSRPSIGTAPMEVLFDRYRADVSFSNVPVYRV